jgi:hypothetical protein
MVSVGSVGRSSADAGAGVREAGEALSASDGEDVLKTRTDVRGRRMLQTADSARSATASVRRLAARRSPGSGAVGLPVCCGTLHG